jgi:serine/threonine protein kinase
MAILEHPNIARLYDFFSDDKHFYLVMDLCPDGELTNYIVKNEKVNEATAALLFRQIVSAVAYCHARGLAHRDLKPENILIEKFPNIKVTDFGLCGYIDPGQLMSTFCGSPCYCAPECLARQEYDGSCSDVWSLGIILYIMVTGHHPWDVSNTQLMMRQILSVEYQIPAFVSPECREMIQSMLKIDPQQRVKAESLLNHPWLKKSQEAKVLKRPGLPIAKGPPLPPLRPESVKAVAQARRTSDQPGIVDPFGPRSSDDSSVVQQHMLGKPRTAETGARRRSIGGVGQMMQKRRSLLGSDSDAPT